LSGFGDVGLDYNRAAAHFLDLGGDRLRGFGLLAIVYRDVSAGFGEGKSDGFADAATGAGDEGDVVL
jgi:hypothetical protein